MKNEKLHTYLYFTMFAIFINHKNVSIAQAIELWALKYDLDLYI